MQYLQQILHLSCQVHELLWIDWMLSTNQIFIVSLMYNKRPYCNWILNVRWRIAVWLLIRQKKKHSYSLHGIIWLGSSSFRIFLLNRSIAVRGSFLTMLSRKADHLHFLKNYKRLRLTLHSKTTTYRHFATIMCASSTLYLVFTGGIQKGICDKTKYLKYYVL